MIIAVKSTRGKNEPAAVFGREAVDYMKTPVCELCAKSGEMCKPCNKLVAEGKISKLDATISHALYAINEKRNISGAGFVRSVELDHLIVIFTDTDPGILIGKGGAVSKELTVILGKKIRIAQSSADPKRSIEDIIAPVPLLGINKMYSSGNEYLKVRLPRGYERTLPLDPGSLQKLSTALLGMQTTVVFE